MLTGQFHNATALCTGAGGTRRVLKIGNHIEQLGLVLREQCFQRGQIGAVGLQGHAHNRGAMTAEQRQCAVIAGRLGEHHIAGLDHRRA